MKKVLFLDRDGTLALEPADEQLDSLEKLEFYPGVFYWLSRIVRELDYELVMVTNQDGLGTDSFPEADFWPAQNKIIQALANEGVHFADILIDKTFAYENANTRKPETGLLTAYIHGQYNLAESVVIGDRITDVKLAHNLGAQSIFITETHSAEANLCTTHWAEIYKYLKGNNRKARLQRKTNETEIDLEIDLQGSGKSAIKTGLAFFDHMLDQIARHGNIDLKLKVEGDLEVDEHHTIEDVAICLGEAMNKALTNKKGMERYGFVLPMDDCLAQVTIDFGGRAWLEWDCEFKREKVGDMPTEMFYHFFKSFSDGARCNLNIKAEGNNEHHKIEAIFKGLARAIKAAVREDGNFKIPTTKGSL